MLRKMIPITLVVITFLICSTGEAKLSSQKNSWIFSITGEITSKEVVETRTALQNIDPDARPLFELNSPGGDIYAAMEIGRLIRKARTTCIVRVNQQCSSACVLILAGGVERTIYGKVAIHRPYSTYVGQRDYQNAENEYRRTETAVRTYLKEMNLPEKLFEAMVQVPPEQVRIISRKESADFGLTGVDAVEQEVRDASSAAAYGISKREYLSRKRQVDEACPLPDELEEPSPRQREDRWQCQEAFMYGVSVEVYKTRKERADKTCSAYKNDSRKFWPCAHSIFRGEK